MTPSELDLIRDWDARCGDNETTFFPVTKDRRRLIEHVDELRTLLRVCRNYLVEADRQSLVEQIDAMLGAPAAEHH